MSNYVEFILEAAMIAAVKAREDGHWSEDDFESMWSAVAEIQPLIGACGWTWFAEKCGLTFSQGATYAPSMLLTAYFNKYFLGDDTFLKIIHQHRNVFSVIKDVGNRYHEDWKLADYKLDYEWKEQIQKSAVDELYARLKNCKK